jgi:hypothetical protein
VTADAYCAERVRAAGGDPELILRFAPEHLRAPIEALAALRGELEHLVEQKHEPAVAAAKLAWWRTEIASFGQGEARHPATRALRLAALDHAALARAMLRFSQGLEAELLGHAELAHEDWTALIDSRAQWLHAVAVATQADAPADAAAVALAELEVLATVGRRVKRARPAIDASWGLTTAGFIAQDPAAQALIAARARGFAAMLTSTRLSSAPLAVAVALGLRRARRLAADPRRAWHPEPAASLGALFTAWRAAL